jgi:hypothetical protein
MVLRIREESGGGRCFWELEEMSLRFLASVED